jgi:hypothetical protein
VVEVPKPVELTASEEEPIGPAVPTPDEPADPEELPPTLEPELEPMLPEVLAPEPDPEELASSVFLPQAPSISKPASAKLTAAAGLILDVYIWVSF